jgi:hypothetical protein
LSSETWRRCLHVVRALAAAAGAAAFGLWACASAASAYDDWSFHPDSGPAQLATGLNVSGTWDGGRISGFPAGMWEFFEPSTGTMVYGFCLDLSGEFSFGTTPFHDGGPAPNLRGDYGPVAYLIQKEWPNLPNASDPGGATAPLVAATGRADDRAYDAAAIQAAIWSQTNGFRLDGCGCDYGALSAAYAWSLGEAQRKASLYCFNHSGSFVGPADGTSVVWGGGSGQAVGQTVGGHETGDCGDNRPVPGAFVDVRVTSPNAQVSIDGGAFSASVDACCGPTDAGGDVRAAFVVSQPCYRCTVEADVTVSVFDDWQGAILRVDRGSGAQPVGVSAYARNGRGYLLYQETRRYLFADAEPDLVGDARVTDASTGTSGTAITAHPGDTLEYRYRLDNTRGTADAQDVAVESPMSTGNMDLLESVQPDARGRLLIAHRGGARIVWSVGTLPARGADEVAFTAQVPWSEPAGTLVLTNQGHYTLSNGPAYDPNATTVTVDYAPPSEPSGAGAGCDGASTTSAVISWLPVDGADGYRIYQDSPGSPTLVGSVSGGGTSSAWVSGLTPGTAYTWAVTALSGGGESDPSAAAPTDPAFDPGTCAAPAAPVITAAERCAGGAGAHLAWNRPASPAPVVRYQLTADRGGYAWTVTGADTSTWTVTDQTGASWTVAADPGAPALDVSGLRNVTEYTFAVVAYTASQPSPVSYPSNAITPTCAA